MRTNYEISSLQKALLVLCRNDDSTSVLVISGTHGKDGVTGLTDRNKLARRFYEGDCKSKNLKVLVDIIFIENCRCWSCSEDRIR